jgi:hypothetical protein
VIHVISLGAGVQSSTMALMAAHGEITPMPDCAIFADTGWEPATVYTWLDWLEKKLPFPVHRVAKPGDFNIRDHTIKGANTSQYSNGSGRTTIPFFVLPHDGGKAGLAIRKCTKEFKIEPIENFIRRTLLGLKPRQRAPRTPVVTQWRGISADEAQRMKPSRDPWMTARYPLAMEHGMTRADCLAWMARKGYPQPPRSACIGCPFHSDHEWMEMRDKRPDEWADAVQFDKETRHAAGTNGTTFLHSDCKPLDEVEFKEDRYAGNFGNECEGMCGV